jgi:hypothetical protein
MKLVVAAIAEMETDFERTFYMSGRSFTDGSRQD